MCGSHRTESSSLSYDQQVVMREVLPVGPEERKAGIEADSVTTVLPCYLPGFANKRSKAGVWAMLGVLGKHGLNELNLRVLHAAVSKNVQAEKERRWLLLCVQLQINHLQHSHLKYCDTGK